MPELYYTPPTDEQFNELKSAAIEILKSKDSHPNYVDEKVGRIKDITNISDNFMYMVAMFDASNQMDLSSRISEGTRKAVRDRMVDGGQPEHLIYF